MTSIVEHWSKLCREMPPQVANVKAPNDGTNRVGVRADFLAPG
ncbi:MAG: hypothetical protein QOH76_1556 [Thermoleophilaceae bacterium]|jgi:hypothetical protein|nr:hypothetical protein [Thermoleophilaceae bacterium]